MGYIQLNQNNFFHNLDYFSSLCQKEKLSIALKDNAYGHGIYEVASMCAKYGIQHIFVRNINEANVIKEFNFKSVLVLYDIPKSHNPNIVISINSLDDIKKIPSKSKVELKIDTGMNRNGIFYDQIDTALESIKKQNLILNGVFTHFCCSDEQNNITSIQEDKFQKAILYIKTKIDDNFRVHCANSHGVFKVDMQKYDLARIGIGAYGYLEFEQSKYLKPVASLWANKIVTKHIKKGEHIGYGSKAFVAHKDMVVTNYDVGYSDGFLRISENKPATIQDGRKILGRSSMDSLSIESNDPKICIFDNVQSLATTHLTIVYEILTTLSPFIPRIII
jgi:alanine racemase